MSDKVAKTIRGTFVCDELRALREQIDRETVWVARYRKRHINDAINWGDWSCRELAYQITDNGRERYVAYFEEGAPDTREFFDHLRERLSDLPCHIEFEAEW